MQSSTIFLNPSLNFPSRIHLIQPKADLFQPISKMSSLPSFLNGCNNSRITSKIRSISDVSASSSAVNSSGFCSLIEYLGKGGEDVGDDLVVLLNQLAYAGKKIAALVASPFNSSLGTILPAGSSSLSDRDNPKPLDIVALNNGAESSAALLQNRSVQVDEVPLFEDFIKHLQLKFC